MLRMYLLQGWFNLSDEGVEDAIYDNYAMRKFMGINFMEEGAPDATTLLKFRRILENSGLGKAMFEGIVKRAGKRRPDHAWRDIVDATIINAPSSTKNEKRRDPEMEADHEGQGVEVWDEDPHRRGCRLRVCNGSGRDCSQCT